ncbi:PEP-CTERM sorting domain-containing protein [Pseudocolwellia agarivorans]|uniref:PEP-CTERM sorting domain-containing protein n=1 Tax=Pseudocolwellia agarivorans TaxID=1911682 RepID=UPI000985C48D|nr:PEP-CTERM sorting domain-containing protein [Pseudocolwellia agarivorans]
MYIAFIKLIKYILCSTCIFAATASAAIIQWADWQSGTANEVIGEFVTTTSTVNITYTNPQGYAFLQTGTGFDYFHGFEDVTRSPYTSAFVENIPTAAEMIALRYAGSQTLTFSETVANPVFSYVSLNGNGYAFDQDFEILSFGDGVDNLRGHWGAGTSYKDVVDIGGGVMEYRLLGTGEPHGTIRFTGAFDSVTWQSSSNENWNGFTVGIQGTAKEVFDVPEPSTLAIFSLAVMGLVTRRVKNK